MIIAVIYATFAAAKRKPEKAFFFRLSFRNCKSRIYNCDDHSSFNNINNNNCGRSKQELAYCCRGTFGQPRKDELGES